MFSKILVGFTFFSLSAAASYQSAESNYGRGTVSLSGYRTTITNLVSDGYYFSVIPWVKDYLVKSSSGLDSEMEIAFDRIISEAGVKPFETLPEDILRRSRSGNIRYILAKRLMRNGKNQEALSEVSRVSGDHPAYPYIAHMKGSLHSILGNSSEAQTQFKDCVRYSEKSMKDAKSSLQRKQLEINKDYCIAGLARAQFGRQDYKSAELNYLDIPKSSYVWPEILFEEAWTSYYVKNYNRTLGKLISYKAPVFDFIFKPEIEVLKALTYMKMCLYDDAKKTVDDFYNERLQSSRDLRKFLLSRGKDYRYFYSLMADYEENKASPLPIADSILKSIQKDGAFIEMKGALTSAMAEYNNLRKMNESSLRSNLMKNLKTVIDEYRTIIGAYVRTGMVSKYAELYSAFQNMSYIKLEVLAQRKERLYQTDVPQTGKRGDVQYIDRNDKQYFWTFNGEFWADELGDYVFALRSEC